MKPTDILSDEHRLIEQVLDCLEKMAQECTSSGTLDEQPARDAVTFFAEFADRCHHAKEETHLFPAMESKGFPREGGPTAVMRQEHEIARSRVRGMVEAIDAAVSGDKQALAQFVENARLYIELLREHIHKENHCLFPMADNAFSRSEQDEMLATFERVKTEEIGEATYQKYIQIANHLVKRYGVLSTVTDRAEREGDRCESRCGHG